MVLCLIGVGTRPAHTQTASGAAKAATDTTKAANAHLAGNTTGQFDFYLLDLVPGPRFCEIKDVGPACQPQTGLVVHGLWPQNNDDTWPQFCSNRSHETDLHGSLDLTPDLHLLQHEWDKHGTCTGLSGAEYFAAEHVARAQVTVPQALLTATPNRTFTPLFLLNMFYLVNPALPPGSLSLSCREDTFTAIEACFDKKLQPAACVGLHGCQATAISIRLSPQT